MKISLLIKFAIGRLWEGRLKSQLTFAGLSISIIFMVLLLSFSYGLDNAVNNSLQNSAIDKQIEVYPSSGQSLLLNSEAQTSILGISGVVSAERKADIYAKSALNGTYLDVLAQAIDVDYLKKMGRTLPNNTEFKYYLEEKVQLVVTNAAMAKAYGFDSPEKFKGQEISLDVFFNKNNSELEGIEDGKERRVPLGAFKVLDVITDGTTPYVYFPHQIAETAGLAYDSSIQVTTSDPRVISEIRSKIEAFGFRTESMAESIKGINNFFGLVRTLLILFSLVTCMIATIGLLSLMSSEIAERREEISFMKLIGFSNTDVRGMIGVECIFLSVFGTGFGILIGDLLGKLFNYIFKRYSETNQFEYFDLFSTPIRVIILIGIFSIVYGIIIGYIASWKIKKVPANLVLRSE